MKNLLLVSIFLFAIPAMACDENEAVQKARAISESVLRQSDSIIKYSGVTLKRNEGIPDNWYKGYDVINVTSPFNELFIEVKYDTGGLTVDYTIGFGKNRCKFLSIGTSITDG